MWKVMAAAVALALATWTAGDSAPLSRSIGPEVWVSAPKVMNVRLEPESEEIIEEAKKLLGAA
jgi:hypothetical protein